MTEIININHGPESLVEEWAKVQSRPDENPTDFAEECRLLALIRYRAQEIVNVSGNGNVYRLFSECGIAVERKSIMSRLCLCFRRYMDRKGEKKKGKELNSLKRELWKIEALKSSHRMGALCWDDKRSLDRRIGRYNFRRGQLPKELLGELPEAAFLA